MGCKMEMQWTGSPPTPTPPEDLSWHPHCIPEPTQPLSQERLYYKIHFKPQSFKVIYDKNYSGTYISCHSSFSVHRQLFLETADTDGRFGIQWVLLSLSSFLLCLPSPSVLEALLSQTLPYESEEAVSLLKPDVISSDFYGMFSLAL